MLNSKAWCPINFLLKYYLHIGIEDKNTKNSIKSKNYPKSKNTEEVRKTDIDAVGGKAHQKLSLYIQFKTSLHN